MTTLKIIILTLYITCSFSQVYNWLGSYNYLFPIPFSNSTSINTCCTPVPDFGLLNITQVNDTISFSLVPPNLNCGQLNSLGYNETSISIQNGTFVGVANPNLMGIYYPNNNSFQIITSDSNCGWVFGDSNTITTNLTIPSLNGTWGNIQTMSYANGNATCCAPQGNITIVQYFIPNSLYKISLSFPSTCDNIFVNGSSYVVDESMLGGGFTDSFRFGNTTILGFYFPTTNTIAIMFDGCASFFYNYKSSDIYTITNSTNITIIDLLFSFAEPAVKLSFMIIAVLSIFNVLINA